MTLLTELNDTLICVLHVLLINILSSLCVALCFAETGIISQ